MFSNSSLLARAQLFVALIVLCIGVPAVLLGTSLIYQRTKADTLLSLSERAPLVLQLIENDIRAKQEALAHAASLFQADRIEDIDQAALDRVVQGFSGVIWAGLAGTDGRVRLSHRDLLKNADVSKRPWFQSGLKAPSVMDRHEALLLAKLLPAREQPYRFIDVAVPVHSPHGDLLGVLALHIDWAWYQNQFPGVLGGGTDSSEVTYAVFGADRSIRLLNASEHNAASISVADQAEDLEQRLSQDFYFTTLNGPAGGVFDSLKWTLYVLERKDFTHATVLSAAVFAVLSFLAGLLAASLLYLWMAGRLSGLSARFVDALIARDEQTLSAIRQHLPTEILPLSAKAEKLIGDLRERRTALEVALHDTQGSYLEINQLIAQAPLSIAMFDRGMNYLACSNLWIEQYLPDQPTPLGRCHYDLIPGMPIQWRQAHELGLSGQIVKQDSDHWVDEQGEMHWLDWTVQPWRTEGGEIGGIIIITEDVTQANVSRIALEQSEERFQLAMKGSHDGLWDWDIQTNTVFFSPAWKTMLGYQPDELEASFATWERLVHPDDLEGAKQILNTALARPFQAQFTSSFRLAHKEGHWVKILSRGLILRDSDGKPRRMVGTHLDRTEIESLQHELEEAWVLAQAEAKSNETKSRFLATVSHEIRNPLNSVCGFARLIRDEAQEPEVRRYAQLLMQTTDALTLVLNDLLDFAKIDAGKMELHHEPLNLMAVMDELSEGAFMLCREKGLTFEYTQHCEGGVHYLGDAGRIRQIVQNLLSNAIKFTSTGQVSLRLVTLKDQAGQSNIRIEVEDTGMGVANEHLNALFKPFSQIHKDANNRLGGTGLGLAIVKAITEMMQGNIGCESRLGQGSRFTVTLHLKPTELHGAPVLRREPTGESRTVLVADDSPTNLRILDAFLSRRGHRVSCAEEGCQALALLQTQHFDYALLDMDMPGLSGQAVLEQARAILGPNTTTHFACLSGHVSGEAMQAALSAGFQRYFVKPVNLDDLLDYIQDDASASSTTVNRTVLSAS